MKQVTLSLLFLVGNLYSIYAQIPHAVPVSFNCSFLNDREYIPVRNSISNSASSLVNEFTAIDSTETSVVIIDGDELSIRVAPNPANNYLTLLSGNSLNGEIWTVCDNSGVVWIQQELTSSTVDVSTLTNGAYHWMVSDAAGAVLFSGTVIIQK